MNRLIVALDRKRGIGKNGGQPWKIPDDEGFFTRQTKSRGGIVLVGRTTYETFHGPLEGRQNFVLTRHTEPLAGATVVHDLEAFLKGYASKDVWVVGGGAVFKEVIERNLADELLITEIDADFGCDTFFPAYDNFKQIEQGGWQEENGFRYRYTTYAPAA